MSQLSLLSDIEKRLNITINSSIPREKINYIYANQFSKDMIVSAFYVITYAVRFFEGCSMGTVVTKCSAFLQAEI